MEKQILPGASVKDRTNHLANMSDVVVDGTYFKQLSEEELTEKKDSFTRTAITLSRLEDEKKAFAAEMKERMDPIKEVYSELIDVVKTGFEEVEGKLFGQLDREAKKIYFYDEDGYLIENETRPATREELTQLSIHSVVKEGTND